MALPPRRLVATLRTRPAITILTGACQHRQRHLRFLEISYQVSLLRPPIPAVTARLVKGPKLYWTDPALARVLAEQPGVPNGALFETGVLDELLCWLS